MSHLRVWRGMDGSIYFAGKITDLPHYAADILARAHKPTQTLSASEGAFHLKELSAAMDDSRKRE